MATVILTEGRTIGEVYTALYAQLEAEGLVDEYFSDMTHHRIPGELFTEDKWPDARWISCFAVTGDSEGYYIHVEAIYKDNSRKLLFLGKTLQEGLAGLSWSYRIALRCAELLNA